MEDEDFNAKARSSPFGGAQGRQRGAKEADGLSEMIQQVFDLELNIFENLVEHRPGPMISPE